MIISIGKKKKIVLPKKLAGTAKSLPEYGGVKKGEKITNPNDTYFSESIQDLRSRNQVIPALRKLAAEEGNFSASIFNLVQVANSGFKIRAYDSQTNEFSQDGVQVANSILASIDTLFDYSQGYVDKKPFSAVTETLLREVPLTGGCCLELILDKLRLPHKFQPVDYASIEMISDGIGGKYPRQKALGGGDPIDLNISTFFMAELHQEADKAYATPMMKAALNMVYYYNEFIEEMRRVVRKSGHGRLMVSLDSEKVQASAPSEIQDDPDKLATYMAEVQTAVEKSLADLEPEDSIVAYDSAQFDTENLVGTKSDYSPMMSMLAGITATSMKTHPSIIGMRIEGSQSLSNTESLVYLKVAKAIQGPPERVLSRALTLAARLLGQDVYVKFEFNDINLRPEDELEAFKTMKQNRILNNLSHGLITDEYAYNELDLPYNSNAKPLSGTGFWQSKVNYESDSPSPNSDSMGRSLQPDNEIPRNGGGKDQ